MRPDELDVATKLYFGLQAAKQLLEFIKIHVESGNVTMDGYGIDLPGGDSIEFTPVEYFDFAIQAQDIALAQIMKAAQIRMKQGNG